MATMQELRAEAKAAGVPVSEIRSAESAEELQGLIAGSTGQTRKAVKKVAVKKAVAKKRGRPVGSKNKPKATVAKRGPGRPRKTEVISKAPAKRGRPKGSTTKTVARKVTTNGRLRNVTSTEGRHILEGVDYSNTDGWNPRKGSTPDVILNALRRFKGNREKVFEYLKAEMWDHVGRKRPNGENHTKASGEAMLRYRIARTDWDFALKTGQHKKSTKRVEYGTGGFGKNGNSKRTKTRKAATTTAPKKRGRPAKATATAPKRRGRPPGSKNRPKAAQKTTTAKRSMKRR